MKQAHIAVVGAGIAGIATAYYLAVKHARQRIFLVDKLPPMSLTTSKSGENFRDYWPQACMAEFTTHSLDLMQALIDTHGDVFHMRSFGYDFVSHDARRDLFPAEGGMDSDRVRGLRRCTDSQQLHDNYPYLSERVRQVLHIDRAGAIDVYALGSLMLAQARRAGLEQCQGEVVAIEKQSDSGFSLQIQQDREVTGLRVDYLVLAAGPFTGRLAAMLDIELPVQSVSQRKFVIPDPLRVIPVDMPFTIYADSQHLDWSEAERDLIAADPDYSWLLEEFPPGLHIKPESGGHIKMGWAYNRTPESPRWEATDDPDFPGVVMRGASRFIPGLGQYVDNMPTPIVQYAGYYTRTEENWPIIGPLPCEGLYTVAALSGYGTMAACSAGELCADYLMEVELPSYARNFHPDRYSDPVVMAEIAAIESDGQL